jgi:MFS family permease
LQSGGILCLSVVTGLVAHFGTPDNTNDGGAIAAIVFMFLFITFYGSCVDASSYIYCAELFPTHVRAQGVGFSTSAVFLLNTGKCYCIVQIARLKFTVYNVAAGTAFRNIGWRFYLVFIIVPSCALPFIYFLFPETKGLTLEEVGRLFGDEVIRSELLGDQSEKIPSSKHLETKADRLEEA